MYAENYMFFSARKNLLLYKTIDKYFEKFKINNQNIKFVNVAFASQIIL